MTKTISIVHLYPAEMNIYGDHGNVLTLVQRLRWAGYVPNVHELHPGSEMPQDVDIIVGGGGQDSNQLKVAQDLQRHKNTLAGHAHEGTPMLVICGMYQLFGTTFVTHTGKTVEGIGVLDIETRGSKQRMIGNVVCQSPEFGAVVGYENHSGHTTLGTAAAPLGTTEPGMGNNPVAKTEGARQHKVVGSYLHGSLLPKNPAIADFIISTAVENRYNEAVNHVYDDALAHQAREVALASPR